MSNKPKLVSLEFQWHAAQKALRTPKMCLYNCWNARQAFILCNINLLITHSVCTAILVKWVVWGHRVCLRLNDNFIMQSIPLGDDRLNRAWWFIMGVITKSFSSKSTTWLPTRTCTNAEKQRWNVRDSRVVSQWENCTEEMKRQVQ